MWKSLTPWWSVPRGKELPVTSDALAITGTQSQDWRAWWHDVFLQSVSWVPSPRVGVQCFVFFFPCPKPSLITELHVACLYCGPPCLYFLWALTVCSLEILVCSSPAILSAL